MQYRFTLKDNNEKTYRLFNVFLFFLHIVAAGVLALNAVENKVKLSLYILLGFYLLVYLVYFFFKRHPKALETCSLIMALLYMNFWFRYVAVVAGIIFVVVYLFVAVVQAKKTSVLFSDNGVHLTRVFKTIIFPWSAMANVILKDNLLTIDFKTNKIIQVEISENELAVDEEGFNVFCTEQLQLNPDLA